MLFKKSEPTVLEKLIDTQVEELNHSVPGSADSEKIWNRVVKLHELKAVEERTQHVSPDTKALIAANLAGIGMIISYEHAHVVTSKAMGLLLRAKS